MPKVHLGGRRAVLPQQQPPQPEPEQPQVQPAPPPVAVSNVPVDPQPLTQAQADAMRQAQDASYDASTMAAVKMYISNTDFDRMGHSMSQAMNYALDHGVDFSQMTPAQINSMLGTRFNANDIASMQYTDAYMGTAAHPIGQDVSLVRGAHDDVLRDSFGIRDYSRMSEAQLQSTLVGQTFQTTSYMSTSYDVTKNPFLSASSGSGVSGGREVVFRIKAGAQTRMVFGAKKQAEVILAKGTNFRVTGVKYTGGTATPRGGASKKQIQIDIETF